MICALFVRLHFFFKIITTIPIYFIYLADEIDNYLFYDAAVNHEVLLQNNVKEVYISFLKKLNRNASPKREAFFE